MWNFTLVIFWSLAAESSSLHATMFLANCLITTVQLLSVFFFLSFFFFLQVAQSDRNQSRERDHRGSKSKERERSSRDGELPSTSSQTVARDRAIKQKRREIDEVKEVSLHKHTCTLGAGLVINRLRKRGDKRGRD